LKKYEYRTERPLSGLPLTEKELNKLGAEGWKLVGFAFEQQAKSTRGGRFNYVFMRPTEHKEDE